jgi:hypothetical protein
MTWEPARNAGSRLLEAFGDQMPFLYWSVLA